MTPRLLLFDLDGTLLNSAREIPAASIAALTAAMQHGVRVGLATGRSRVSVSPYLDALRPNGPLILLNGCVLWDVPSDRAVASRTLPRADALRLVEATLELEVHANVYIDRTLFVAHRGALSLASEAKDGVPHTEVADLMRTVQEHASAPFKLLCIDESRDFSALRARFEEVLESPCTMVQSEPTYLEVLPPGVDKGAMLAEIEIHYGIAPADVVAFGDELNDVELLRAAGTAVVMGNANPTLLELGDIVIGTHDSDAIAQYVRQLLAL